MIEMELYPIPEVNSYANALNYATAKEENIMIIGNYCLNLAHRAYKKDFIHKINYNTYYLLCYTN